MHTQHNCAKRNISQRVLATLAMDCFAESANTSFMRNLAEQQREWLAQELAKHKHGVRKVFAEALGLRPEMITRILKGEREVSAIELSKASKFFGSEAPGLADLIPHAIDATPRRFKMVPLLDRVSAGKLKTPGSQIPMEDVLHLAFADLGPGDFFALKVDSDSDSMDRISPPGSIIIVNRADRVLLTGKCYVFCLNGETTYKMWQDGDPAYLTPYSTNPLHKPIIIKRKRDMDVIGRVKKTVLDL